MEWNYFLRVIEGEGEEEVRVQQWWTPLCRNWSAPAALHARSPTSHRYSCTKQNKLPIPAVQYVFQRASPERKPSRLLSQRSWSSRACRRWGQREKNFWCATTKEERKGRLRAADNGDFHYQFICQSFSQIISQLLGPHKVRKLWKMLIMTSSNVLFCPQPKDIAAYCHKGVKKPENIHI